MRVHAVPPPPHCEWRAGGGGGGGGDRRLLDITRDKPVKLCVRVAVPVRDHPKSAPMNDNSPLAPTGLLRLGIYEYVMSNAVLCLRLHAAAVCGARRVLCAERAVFALLSSTPLARLIPSSFPHHFSPITR
ncbi:hypothetical protein MSG28_013920 [Choristoneura fumiferana]|uniref:Uncharacterized protein n=1 Tax=Choristoneura fumiferana TaxID=7141 RepID=A0ACC0K9F7_CHOFU|nr:hypothetical protein MSG28_013920 [Choristoneura fumiferana]